MDEGRRRTAVRAHRSTDETLRRLLESLTPELRALLEHGENFQVVIHASAGHTFKIEFLKIVNLN